MKGRKLTKTLAKTRKIAGYVSIAATIGIFITTFIMKRKKRRFL